AAVRTSLGRGGCGGPGGCGFGTRRHRFVTFRPAVRDVAQSTYPCGKSDAARRNSLAPTLLAAVRRRPEPPPVEQARLLVGSAAGQPRPRQRPRRVAPGGPLGRARRDRRNL